MTRKDFYNRTYKALWCLVLAAALLLRCVLAAQSEGMENDIGCFFGWAIRAYEEGLGNFYTSGNFSDYPPGYIYVLYLIGWLFSNLHIVPYTPISLLLIRLPAILCDLGAGALIYHLARKHREEESAQCLAALYLFNPAVILNSAVWGQVDAVYTLLLLLSLALLSAGWQIPVYAVFGLGVLIKPQMVIFGPVLIWAIIDGVVMHNFSWRRFFLHLGAGLGVLGGLVLLCLPFGLGPVVSQYLSTVASYPYAACNAFNLWGLLGMNWTAQETRVLFFSCQTWGSLAIAAAVVLSAAVYVRTWRRGDQCYLAGAALIATVFLFSVRMHERYLFPVMALLLMSCVLQQDRGLLAVYCAFSAVHCGNTWYTLYCYNWENYNGDAPVIFIGSAATLLCGAWFYFLLWRRCTRPRPVGRRLQQERPKR